MLYQVPPGSYLGLHRFMFFIFFRLLGLFFLGRRHIDMFLIRHTLFKILYRLSNAFPYFRQFPPAERTATIARITNRSCVLNIVPSLTSFSFVSFICCIIKDNFGKA